MNTPTSRNPHDHQQPDAGTDDAGAASRSEGASEPASLGGGDGAVESPAETPRSGAGGVERAEIIYDSCEAANDALGPCPRALAGSDGGHWWYCDHALMEDDAEKGVERDYVPCICKSCPQTMRLSIEAEEYPL